MNPSPRILYITAGAGGMYCGSCLRDNLLVSELEALGWDATLLPLYTPIRVDGADRSVDRVFFGGVNVYLQQRIPFFRHLPAFLDRWLNNPGIIRRVTARAVSVSARELGDMTLSMVKGEDGFQRKEVRRLLRWLKGSAKPDLICLSNLLVGGSIPALKRELGVPVLVTLQGDDVFLDELEEPWRGQVLAEMRRLAGEADGFITFSEFYRRRMERLLEIPGEKFRLTPLGIRVEDFDEVREARAGRPPGRTVGYFARIAPEKGFDTLVDAFVELARRDSEVQLRAGGWLSEKDRAFCDEQEAKIEAAGLGDRYRRIEAPDGKGKLDFLKGIDVFSVPTRFAEPKGLYVLEAMACALPVAAPQQGAFPELIESSGGGVLFGAGDASDLAGKLASLLDDPAAAARLGRAGRAWVERSRSARAMAEATAEVFREALGRGPQAA